MSIQNLMDNAINTAHSKMGDYWDRIIHGGTVVSIIFAGMSLQDAVLVIPAIVSVGISIVAFLYRRHDKNRRFKLYQEQEEKRTRILENYMSELVKKNITDEVNSDPTSVRLMMDKVGKLTATNDEGDSDVDKKES